MAAFLASGLTSNLLSLGSGHLWEYVIEQKVTYPLGMHKCSSCRAGTKLQSIKRQIPLLETQSTCSNGTPEESWSIQLFTS